MFHLRRLGLLLLHLPSDEAIQHRLEEVDHKLDFSFLLVACQVDHFVLVACHQTFVANRGFLVKFRAQERKWGRGEDSGEELWAVCIMCGVKCLQRDSLGENTWLWSSLWTAWWLLQRWPLWPTATSPWSGNHWPVEGTQPFKNYVGKEGKNYFLQ